MKIVSSSIILHQHVTNSARFRNFSQFHLLYFQCTLNLYSFDFFFISTTTVSWFRIRFSFSCTYYNYSLFIFYSYNYSYFSHWININHFASSAGSEWIEAQLAWSAPELFTTSMDEVACCWWSNFISLFFRRKS